MNTSCIRMKKSHLAKTTWHLKVSYIGQPYNDYFTLVIFFTLTWPFIIYSSYLSPFFVQFVSLPSGASYYLELSFLSGIYFLICQYLHLFSMVLLTVISINYFCWLQKLSRSLFVTNKMISRAVGLSEVLWATSIWSFKNWCILAASATLFISVNTTLVLLDRYPS